VVRLYVLYVDESGVPARGAGQTSHYALAGVAIPASSWAAKRRQLEAIRAEFGFPGGEIHVAWLLRPYVEQLAIPEFESLSADARRARVARLRAAKVKALAAKGSSREAGRLRRFHTKTAAYAHLTLPQRFEVARAVADAVGAWSDAVLFGEVADKTVASPFAPDESAYEQVLTRFEAFLMRTSSQGVVAYDQNDAVAERFTSLMARFQEDGGVWRRLRHVAGHPFFVASHMSDLIQVADVVSYGMRRYCERGERDLLDRYFGRFDRIGPRLVGLRHYRGGRRCPCLICVQPRRGPVTPPPPLAASPR
jgi:hypothetical protein